MPGIGSLLLGERDPVIATRAVAFGTIARALAAPILGDLQRGPLPVLQRANDSADHRGLADVARVSPNNDDHVTSSRAEPESPAAPGTAVEAEREFPTPAHQPAQSSKSGCPPPTR